MSDYITTYTKTHFYPLDPDLEGIKIEDIAHALSLMTRANGHFPEFYSVAQHSIACAMEAKARGYNKKTQLACLIHDASEAYIADITRPVKKELLAYQQVEKKLQYKIYERFLGEEPSEDILSKVKSVDDSMLLREFDYYMGEKLLDAEPIHIEPNFYFQEFKIVEETFLSIYHELAEC